MKFNLFPKEGVEQVIIKAEFPPYFTARETLARMQYVEPILNRIPKSEFNRQIQQIHLLGLVNT